MLRYPLAMGTSSLETSDAQSPPRSQESRDDVSEHRKDDFFSSNFLEHVTNPSTSFSPTAD